MKMTMFEEFDRIFGRMSDRFFETAGSLDGSQRNSTPAQWYGYSIVVGPDGRPVVREFGNVRPGHSGRLGDRSIQVDTIVDEKNNEIKMVAEIPGVEKKDIEIVLEDEGVVIDATRDQTKFHTTVPLRHDVNRDSIKASYKNGILEIVLGIENKPKGKTVRVD